MGGSGRKPGSTYRYLSQRHTNRGRRAGQPFDTRWNFQCRGIESRRSCGERAVRCQRARDYQPESSFRYRGRPGLQPHRYGHELCARFHRPVEYHDAATGAAGNGPNDHRSGSGKLGCSARSCRHHRAESGRGNFQLSDPHNYARDVGHYNSQLGNRSRRHALLAHTHRERRRSAVHLVGFRPSYWVHSECEHWRSQRVLHYYGKFLHRRSAYRFPAEHHLEIVHIHRYGAAALGTNRDASRRHCGRRLLADCCSIRRQSSVYLVRESSHAAAWLDIASLQRPDLRHAHGGGNLPIRLAGDRQHECLLWPLVHRNDQSAGVGHHDRQPCGWRRWNRLYRTSAASHGRKTAVYVDVAGWNQRRILHWAGDRRDHRHAIYARPCHLCSSGDRQRGRSRQQDVHRESECQSGDHRNGEQGTVGVAYPATQFTAAGGTQPYTWSVSAGALPAGLTLSAAGLLSGTPAAAGQFTFTVQVTDANALTASKQFQITVIAVLSVTTASLP